MDQMDQGRIGFKKLVGKVCSQSLFARIRKATAIRIKTNAKMKELMNGGMEERRKTVVDNPHLDCGW